jgi:O-succinylbenzoic acid--CoA ligase
LTPANYAASADATAERLSLDRDDVWLAPMPMHHVGGLSILMRSLRIGLSVVLQPEFDSDRTLERIETEDVTIVSVVPTMLHALLERQREDGRDWTRRFPRLRVVLVGGGPLPAALARRALEADIPIATTYGLTEATSQISTATVAETAADPSHCGHPVRGVEVRLRDVGPDGYGTLWVRGPQVFAGYVGDPPQSGERFDGDWFATGDIAKIDEEGRIRVAMRRDDRIVTGGENVSPAEVETVLGEHPDVSSAGVYGIADEKWGQIVAAAVVLRPGTDFDPEGLTAWCRERMAPYKVPRRIHVRASLPVTAAGKLRRFLLPESD